MIECMIAAPRSGGGKTVMTCALLAALRQRGMNPCAFKCGPDYIDPMFHRAVLGLESHNLDGTLVLPFCTSGGSDISESMPDLTAIANARGARVGTGLTANYIDDSIISNWLSENGIAL